MVIPPKYTLASWFENGVAIVVDPAADFPQVIDTKGQVQNEIRTPIDFGWPKAIRGFNEGGLKVYLKVGPPDKVYKSGLFQYGFLRPDGSWMIEPKLDSASFFHSGLTTVEVSGHDPEETIIAFLLVGISPRTGRSTARDKLRRPSR